MLIAENVINVKQSVRRQSWQPWIYRRYFKRPPTYCLSTDEHWSSAHKAKNQSARKSCLQKVQILEQGEHKSLFISVQIQTCRVKKICSKAETFGGSNYQAGTITRQCGMWWEDAQLPRSRSMWKMVMMMNVMIVDNVDEYHFNGIFALIYILHICEYDKEIIASYVPI